MNKKLLILTTILLTTGCAKTITCTSNSSTEGLTIKQKAKIEYKDNNVKKITSNKEYEFKDEQAFNQFKIVMDYTVNNPSILPSDEATTEETENQTTEQKVSNIISSYKTKGKTYYLTQEYNVENMSEDEAKLYGYTKSKKELLDILKDQGLKCK